jgi:hypothetical protein
LNGADRTALAGEVIVIPAGAAHRNPWNESNEEMSFRHETVPDLGSAVFFESLFSLAQDGKINQSGEVSPLQVIVIGASLESQTYTTGIPISLQKLMIPLLGALGRRLGYPARYSSERSGE